VLFGSFLRSARTREREAGIDHRELACYAGKLTPYVQSNLSNALLTLETLYTRIPSTVISEQQQRELWEQLRSVYIQDIRSALDRIAAVLTAVGCTEEELEAAGIASSGETEIDESSEGCADGVKFYSEKTTEMPLPRVTPLGIRGPEESAGEGASSAPCGAPVVV